MTARFSANQRNTRGHRPRLQRCLHSLRSERHLPETHACRIEDRIPDGRGDNRDGRFPGARGAGFRTVDEDGFIFGMSAPTGSGWYVRQSIDVTF